MNERTMTITPANFYEQMKTSFDVSDFLKKARSDKGISIEQAALDTKIRKVWIEAIELGDYNKLPGTVYAIGFVRTYATYLNLNADIIVKALQTTPEFSSDTSKHPPEEKHILFCSNKRKIILLILSIFFIIFTYLTLFNKESEKPNNLDSADISDMEIEDDLGD